MGDLVLVGVVLGSGVVDSVEVLVVAPVVVDMAVVDTVAEDTEVMMTMIPMSFLTDVVDKEDSEYVYLQTRYCKIKRRTQMMATFREILSFQAQQGTYDNLWNISHYAFL